MEDKVTFNSLVYLQDFVHNGVSMAKAKSLVQEGQEVKVTREFGEEIIGKAVLSEKDGGVAAIIELPTKYVNGEDNLITAIRGGLQLYPAVRIQYPTDRTTYSVLEVSLCSNNADDRIPALTLKD